MAVSSSQEALRVLVEQLYGDEGLTEALTDADAKILLDWGRQQLEESARLSSNQAELESAARQLRRVLKTINRLVGEKGELSETEMIRRLFRLVEQSSQLALLKSISEQELKGDQET